MSVASASWMYLSAAEPWRNKSAGTRSNQISCMDHGVVGELDDEPTGSVWLDFAIESATSGPL